MLRNAAVLAYVEPWTVPLPQWLCRMWLPRPFVPPPYPPPAATFHVRTGTCHRAMSSRGAAQERLLLIAAHELLPVPPAHAISATQEHKPAQNRVDTGIVSS